jgi:hypothetical protein
MIVYISGIINKERFEDAENWLVEQGHTPINPLKLGQIYPNLPHENLIALEYKLLETSDGILMVHKWQKSRTSRSMLSYARLLGKKVLYQDYFGRKRK